LADADNAPFDPETSPAAEVLVPFARRARPAVETADADRRRTAALPRRGRPVQVITWLLLVVGVGGSILAASEWRASVRDRSRHTFAAQASDVVSSVAVSLARLDDLTATMRTLLAADPKMTNPQWTAWLTSLDVAKRYPGSLGVGYVEVVPAAQLAAFAATARADPPGGVAATTPFTVIPAGSRPSYCFIRLRSLGSSLDAVPAGLDVCVVGGTGYVSKPRDTGEFQVAPVVLGTRSVAEIFAPVYQGGVTPSTLADRRALILGVVGGLFDVDAILKSALHPYPGMSAKLLRQDVAATAAQSAAAGPGLAGIFGTTTESAVGSSGVAPTHSILTHSATFESDGTWTIQISAWAAPIDWEATREALVALAVGLLVTLLAFTLVRVLAKGRRRALDLVERRTADLTSSESRFRSLAAASPMGVLQTDDEGRFLYGNERLNRILGRGTDALSGRGWLAAFSTVDQERVLANLHGAVEGPTEGIDAQIVTADAPQWVRFSSAAIVKDGEHTGFVSSLEDVTAEVLSTDRLRAAARHDDLTGLPNRMYFLELLTDALRELPETGGQLGVLFIDLDRFKQVNDSYGHSAGDELLIATAARISNSLRPGDLVARLGGDEFAVLMTGIKEVSTVALVVDRLQVAVARPFAVAGAQATVGASVGLVMVDDPDGDPASILQDADMAMYRAKAGSTRFEVFDVALRDGVLARFETEKALRTALERDEFALAYQPILNLATGEIAGGEALLRWNHPTRGVLLPGEFLPLAESTGLIVPIGDWTMRTAVRTAAQWPAGLRLNVTINFSAQQLTASNLLPTIEELLATQLIEPTQLYVEVLETHLLDEANITTLRELKRLGVQVSIDDFGSGYSSLLYLKRMPADSIKIDRALIEDLVGRREDRIIVAGVIGLAHELGMTVIAEGIEHPAQAEILRDVGCDFGQGFAWSPAVPAAAFVELLRTGVPVLR
jgi:diguanylate cyclase (GGDEF)-like protein/PAS domain S-box-containing protein